MASVIHSLWERGDRNPFIMPCNISIDEPRVQFELCRNSFHELPGGLVIGAALEVEDLDPRRLHALDPSITQHAATCSALSAKSDSASSSISATLESAIRL